MNYIVVFNLFPGGGKDLDNAIIVQFDEAKIYNIYFQEKKKELTTAIVVTRSVFSEIPGTINQHEYVLERELFELFIQPSSRVFLETAPDDPVFELLKSLGHDVQTLRKKAPECLDVVPNSLEKKAKYYFDDLIFFMKEEIYKSGKVLESKKEEEEETMDIVI